MAACAVAFALFRRERGVWIYAAGFVSAFVAYSLLLGQGDLPRAFSCVLASALLVFFQLCLAWGYRSRSGARPGWPRRFWAYAAATLASLSLATALVDSFALRAILSSCLTAIAAIEFLAAIRASDAAVAPILRLSARVVALAFIAFHAGRIALLAASGDSSAALAGDGAASAGLTEDGLANAYTLSFSLLFSVLWAGLVVALDVADLLSQLGRKNDALQAMATSDELTGLRNRHSLEPRLRAEMERSSRYGLPLSIVLFDIDHFKRVNDTWGHQAGDEVLRRMAGLASALVREPDDLFRWGGEEFLLVAPHTALAGAAALAEKLRLAVAREAFPLVGEVTASFGVAEWPPEGSLEAWFARVDQALYRAKNGGRNRVVAIGGDEALPVASVRIAWRDEWSSGNELIDAQHIRLIELANSLLAISLSGGEGESDAVDALVEHVKAHFADEERVLAEVGYPDAAAHAKLHAGLSLAAGELRTRLGAEGSSALFDFLVNRVVVEHLVKADSLFFAYTRGARG